jgi:hypothetical protein
VGFEEKADSSGFWFVLLLLQIIGQKKEKMQTPASRS